MTYIEEDGVAICDDARGSVNIYTNHHDQVLYPYKREVPIILRGLLTRLKEQLQDIEPANDETYDTFDAAEIVIRYLENHR
jgi:hypothetical protein